MTIEPRRQKVLDAAQRLNLGMDIAFASGELLEPLGVHAVPSTVFVSPDGIIVAKASGYRSRRFFEARARELLESSRR